MYGPAIPNPDLADLAVLPRAFTEANWYAAQIGVNQEKQVAVRLQDKGVESFLPLYEEVRRRTDRKVVLQMPLFPGYLFVRIALRNRLEVLVVPHVVRLVAFGAHPVSIPDQDIEIMRSALANRRAAPHPYLQVGRRVRVIAGPFQGLEGVLVRRKNSFRIVVSIEAIVRSFIVEVEENEVEPIGRRSITSVNQCQSALIPS